MFSLEKKAIENNIIYYVLIVCFCANLLGRGSVVCLLLSVFSLFLFGFQLRVDINSAVLLIFALSVSIVSAIHYSVSDAFRAINFFMMYVLGHNGFILSKNRIAFIKRTVFAIFLGFDINIILTYFYNFRIDRIKIRTIYSFWTHELVSVTLVGLLSSIVIGYSFYAIFCNNNTKLKIFSISSLVIMLLVNISTATRTPIVMLLLVFFITITIYCASVKNSKALKALLMCSALLVLLIILYSSNAFNIKNVITSNPLYYRFSSEGFKTGRWEIDLKYLKLMPQYIWGGSHIYNTVHKMAHNFLLECYDIYGLVAFASLLVIYVGFICNYIRLVLKKNKSSVDFLLMPVCLAVAVQLLIEPVFQGYPPLVLSMLLIYGITSAYLKNKSISENT